MLLNIIIFLFLTIICQGEAQNNLEDFDVTTKIPESDYSNIAEKLNNNNTEKVDVKLYYESLCPFCMDFYVYEFNITVQALSEYLNIHTYPYGNAKTTVNNDTITIKCQHGPDECYGNKLHACAIDKLQNLTQAISFNACLMDNRRSDDIAADECASLMNFNSTLIKDCAKGSQGTKLLQYYGVETKKAGFRGVPHIRVNDQVTGQENFMNSVCSAFTLPPPPCKEINES